MIRFSVVIPVKNEWKLIPKTLPTWYALNPEEVLLCFDRPAHAKTLRVVKSIAKKCNRLELTKILEVPANPKYKFHQAWVRRTGFREAACDVVLTGDIDQSVNPNCLKAIRLVGRNNVGLASLSKFYIPTTMTQFYRTIIATGVRWQSHILRGRRFTGFTGLYAFHRPYWLETESEEQVQRLVNPKTLPIEKRVSSSSITVSGEDVFLRDCMATKYSIIILPDIGAISWRPDPIHDSTFALKDQATIAARSGRSLFGALVYAVSQFHPDYFVYFIQQRRKLHA